MENVGPSRTQENPGKPRKTQEHPGEPRRTQKNPEEPREPRRNQENPENPGEPGALLGALFLAGGAGPQPHLAVGLRLDLVDPPRVSAQGWAWTGPQRGYLGNGGCLLRSFLLSCVPHRN